MLVVGVDAANWKIIKSNLDRLPTFKKLMEEGEYGSIHLKIKPLSAISWTSMFSGKTPEEHGHEDFVENGEPKKREDIPVDFIWDVLSQKGIKVKALNIPLVYPPFNYNCDFQPAHLGLGNTEKELKEQNEKLKKKSFEVAKEKDWDLLIVVFTALDKIQHYHWGEEEKLLKWYREMDEVLGKLVKYDEKILVVSDHGFCDFEKAEVQTLPKVTKSGRDLKGDHSKEAIWIKKNVNRAPESIMDIYNVIKEEMS